MSRDELRSKIFSITDSSFTEIALEVFQFQYGECEIYRRYCILQKTSVQDVSTIEQIPFLPVELFKTHRIGTGNFIEQKTFISSGTTRDQSAQHYVHDIKLYEESILKGFQLFFGSPEQYCFLALLPSYLQKGNSSLVYMADFLIKETKHIRSGFFLYNHDDLFNILLSLEAASQKTILLGVSFALLDFAEKFKIHLNHTAVIETGGMKGRRQEITREALHDILKRSFGVKNIYSEYGMTELLSQAYFLEDQTFHCPPWMKILIRDVNDPLQIIDSDRTGAINIIDLANLDSCAFIATSDLGKKYHNGTFDVLGRMDYSDVRGCNLLME